MQLTLIVFWHEPGRSGSVKLTVADLAHGRQPDARPRQITFDTFVNCGLGGLGYSSHMLTCYDVLPRDTTCCHVLRHVSKRHEEQQDVDDLYERSCREAENEEKQPGFFKRVSTVQHQCI